MGFMLHMERNSTATITENYTENKVSRPIHYLSGKSEIKLSYIEYIGNNSI